MDDVMEDTVQQFHDNFNDVFDEPYFHNSDIFTYPTLFTAEPSIIKNTEKYKRKYISFKLNSTWNDRLQDGESPLATLTLIKAVANDLN